MIEWAAGIVNDIGLVGVALLIALESIFPPIPSEVVLLLTGFNVSEGSFNLAGALAAATVGSVVGALALYAVGRALHEDRLEALIAAVGRWVGVSRNDVHRAVRWFERHERMAVLTGRFVPVVRSLVSVPAGAEKMPLVPFCVLTAVGSFVWNAVWIVLGWRLGDRWEAAERWTTVIDVALVAAVVVGFVVLRVRAVRRTRAASGTVVAAEAAG